MLKRKALMESISSNRHDFLRKTSRNWSLPDNKYRFVACFVRKTQAEHDYVNKEAAELLIEVLEQTRQKIE